MKRFAIVPTVFALVVMVAACTDMSAPDGSGPLFMHGGDHVVPIKGDFAYSDTGQPPVICEGAFAAGDISGPGEASHLGKTVFEFSTVTCVADLVAQTLTIFGASTFTGANGDAFFFTSTNVFDLTAIGPDGVGPFTFTGDLAGGTGRFEGASGSLSGTGLNDFNIASGTFSLNGTISSVGSLKQ